jgi:hypothetical protein
MPDYEVLYPGRFLKKESLAEPKVIRIMAIDVTQLEGERGVEAKVVVKYKAADGDGEMVFCKTNAVLTAEALDERDYDKWCNRLVTIWNNPQVDLKGKKVGGIRVCGSPEMKGTKRVSIKRPRRKNPEIYDLAPTDNKGRPKTKATAPAPPPVETPSPPPSESDMPVFDDAPDVVDGEMVV